MNYKLTCDYCGKEFVKYHKPNTKNHYCSRKCLGAANGLRLRKKKIKTCAECGTEFVYKGHHEKRNKNFFCSPECQAKFKSRPVTVRCDWCGKTITRKASAISRFGNNNFCDRDCYREYVDFAKYDKTQSDPKVDGQVIHRRVVERMIGRRLLSTEEVHHIDGNHQNNTPSNLVILSKSEHAIIHSRLKRRDRYGRFIKSE